MKIGKQDERQFNLDDTQLLLKGAQLANTEWVLGQVVYTGKQTKIMMNLQSGQIKMSHLERQINKLVINLICVQCILCTIMAIATSGWFRRHTWDDHFGEPGLFNVNGVEFSDTAMSIISFFTYFLLLHTFLPISLQVTIEVVKVV